jgi:hypothetical protein
LDNNKTSHNKITIFVRKLNKISSQIECLKVKNADLLWPEGVCILITHLSWTEALTAFHVQTGNTSWFCLGGKGQGGGEIFGAELKQGARGDKQCRATPREQEDFKISGGNIELGGVGVHFSVRRGG